MSDGNMLPSATRSIKPPPPPPPPLDTNFNFFGEKLAQLCNNMIKNIQYVILGIILVIKRP